MCPNCLIYIIMQRFSNSYYGYNVMSENVLEFFHVLLDQVSLKMLCQEIAGIDEIEKLSDGSIAITTKTIVSTLRSCIAYFEKMQSNYWDTPQSLFQIDTSMQKQLIYWGSSFQGCIAMLLTKDPSFSSLYNHSWNFLKSQIGGIFVSPYTILFYENHAKIIHPITIQNYNERKLIEETIAKYATSIATILKRTKSENEGATLISFVAALTQLDEKSITENILEKSLFIDGNTVSL